MSEEHALFCRWKRRAAPTPSSCSPAARRLRCALHLLTHLLSLAGLRSNFEAQVNGLQVRFSRVGSGDRAYSRQYPGCEHLPSSA